MKKINSSYISSSALQPFKQGTWEHLQASYQEAFAAIIQMNRGGGTINSGFDIIYGCNLSVAGGNYTVSAGAIHYNGEIYFVDAVGSTANPTGGDTRICKIATTYLTASNADPVTFTDGSTNNVHEIRKVVIENGTAATSGYIGEYSDLERVCSTAFRQADIAATGSNYTLSFEINRTLDFATFTAGAVSLDYDFNNAAIGSTQRLSATMGNGDLLSALVDSDIVIEVCSGAALTRVTALGPTLETLKTASGTESIVVELTYLGYTSSVHKIGIKIWS